MRAVDRAPTRRTAPRLRRGAALWGRPGFRSRSQVRRGTRECKGGGLPATYDSRPVRIPAPADSGMTVVLLMIGRSDTTQDVR